MNLGKDQHGDRKRSTYLFSVVQANLFTHGKLFKLYEEYLKFLNRL
jgi:hypothetical protein